MSTMAVRRSRLTQVRLAAGIRLARPSRITRWVLPALLVNQPLVASMTLLIIASLPVILVTISLLVRSILKVFVMIFQSAMVNRRFSVKKNTLLIVPIGKSLTNLRSMPRPVTSMCSVKAIASSSIATTTAARLCTRSRRPAFTSARVP